MGSTPREVPMHLARAKLTSLVEQCSSTPILLTRNGKPVALLTSPDLIEGGESIRHGERTAVRANLLAALAILDVEASAKLHSDQHVQAPAKPRTRIARNSTRESQLNGGDDAN